jgi:sulfoxide reductase heme-binding subunit YedZ
VADRITLSQGLNAGLRRLPTWPVYLGLAMPAAILFWQGLSGQLGADPVKALEHQYGKWALQLLILTLLVTPLRRWAGISLLKFRRAFGLMAFGYVVAHLLIWLILDMQFFWTQILGDIAKRPYITIGMVALVLLIPLAATSTNRAIRRLGPLAWARLHRLAYAAAILGAIHYLMVVKAWPLEPILYAIGVPILVLLRFIPRSGPVHGRRTA